MGEELLQKLQREGLKPAPLFKRAVSMIIDDLLISFLVVLAFSNQFSNAKTYEQVILIVVSLFLYIFIAYTLYHWIFIALYGKTIGKMAVKIRVIDQDTFDNPNHIRAFIRSFVRNFDEMFFYLGMFFAVVDPLNRAIHDIAGKSVAVEDLVEN